MKALLCVLLALGIAFPTLAAPDKNPNFVSRDEVQALVQASVQAEIAKLNLLTLAQVQALIDAAIGNINKPAEPPFDVYISDRQYDNGAIHITLSTIINDSSIFPNPDCPLFWGMDYSAISAWGIAYLPSDKILTCTTFVGAYNPTMLDWSFPAEMMPPAGTSVPIEIHAFYAGKSWDLNTVIVIDSPPPSEKPTYTSTNVPIFHGNYGNSSYPCNISDETGNDLFDGNYGMFDWLKKATVQSDADYLARYDQQKGYGLPWVSWQSGRRETVTFDLKRPTPVHQLGFHCYYRAPDIFIPRTAEIYISNDGTNFTLHNTTSLTNYPGIVDDNVQWINVDCDEVTTRYIKIYLTIDSPGDLFIDEISINGKDGNNY